METSQNGHEIVMGAAEVIRLLLMTESRATRTEIRTHCKNQGIDTPLFNKGLAMLNRNLGMLTEVEADGEKAFELKKQATMLTVPELLAIGTKEDKKREVYTDWLTLSGELELTAPCLSSRPVADNANGRCFLRSAEGSILLLSEYYAAMFRGASFKPFAPEIGNARYRLEWDQQEMAADRMYIEKCPVSASRRGEQGRGLTDVEALPVGSRIPFVVTFPQNHISETDFWTIMTIAARWCGFSPSGAHKGWGRFRLVPRVPYAGPQLDDSEVRPLGQPSSNGQHASEQQREERQAVEALGT